MAIYRLNDLLLDVRAEDVANRARLPALLADLSWGPSPRGDHARGHRLSLDLREERHRIPSEAQKVLTTTTHVGFQKLDDFYLTDQDSVLHIEPTRSRAAAYLAPSFFSKALMLQYTFWSFGLAKLLRGRRRYVLHAAGLVMGAERHPGVLVVGASGCGKTTFTLAALRHGWRYASDDAVLLRDAAAVSASDSYGRPARIIASGMRKHCYVDADAVPRHHEFDFGGEVPDTSRSLRRRVVLDNQFGGRQPAWWVPRLLLFPTITNAGRSALVPLDQATALSSLLDASCPQLWERSTMPQHLETLSGLMGQTRAFSLKFGMDAFGDATGLFGELRTVAADVDACVAS